MPVRLTVGFSDNPRVRPLMDGAVTAQNIDLDFVTGPVGELFCRNLKYEEFDVMEMAIGCTIMAKERSDGNRWDWAALPVFLSKSFLFVHLYVNAGSGIKQFRDLAGKRLGVPDYAMDGVFWMNLLLNDLYGIKPRDIAWYIGRAKSASLGGILGLDVNPPAGVQLNWLNDGQTLDVMLDRGEIDAALLTPASLSSQSDRSKIDRYSGTPLVNNPRIHRLFEDGGKEIITAYFSKTGIIPPNHVVVLKNKIAKQNPWIAFELYKAFQRSKAVAYERFRDLRSTYLLFEGKDLHEQAVTFGEDPYPLGIKANRSMLEAALRGALEQGVVTRRFKIEDIFYKTTLDT